MKKVQILFARATKLLLFPLLATPQAAFAFLTVDALPWPSEGAFPAYPRDEARPWSIWAQGGVMRDDNILRRESGGRGDTVSRLGAGIRHEQRIVGRQRLRVEARGDYYAFQNFDQLDHFAYSADGIWEWEVGNNIAGTVFLGRDRRLVDIGETQAAVDDQITGTRLGATAGVFVTPNLRVRGGVATTRAERSARAEFETRANAWTAAVEYVSPLRNTIGLQYRRAQGDAPVPETIAPAGTFVDNDYTEQEVALVATYAPYPMLRADGRVGRTTREYTQLPGRDFEGATWRGRIEWLPGNKTILGFEAYREPRSILDVGASYVLTSGVAFVPRWAVTNKLVLYSRLSRDRRQFEGDPTLVLIPGTPIRDEIVYTARFGVGWEPMRRWQVSAALDIGERESNFAGRDYKFTAATFNVAWRY